MKVSKRLLSIVLMLAMMVSMFTVLAFAANDKVKITFEVGRNGTISIGNEKIKSKTYTFNKADVNAKFVAVSPNAGYAATVKIGDDALSQEAANNGFNLSSDYDGKTIKISFVAKDPTAVDPEPTPTPGTEEGVKLRIGVSANGVTGTKILLGNEELDITKAIFFDEADLEAGVTLRAVASDEQEYSVKWTLNGAATPTEGSTFDLPKTLYGEENKLLVEFTVNETETKHELTVSADSHGNIKYGVNKGKSLTFELEKKETVTVEAVADDGYEFKQWTTDGDVTLSSKKTAVTTITMGSKDAEVTAEFVKKDSAADTYNLTITADGNGKVKFRVNKDTKWTVVTRTNTVPVKKGDTFEIKAESDDGYEASWKVDGKTKTVSDDVYSATVKKADVKVDVTFKESDALKLYVEVSGASHGTLKYREEDETRWTIFDDDDSPLKIKKSEVLEFKAIPDSGYKVIWTFRGETEKTDTEYDVSYKNMGGAKRTLYVEFVRKGSSSIIDDGYPTLTFDITGSKHGTVTRNNGYKVSDGDVVSIKKNDTRTFKADPDKGYVAVWTLGGETYVGNSFTMKMGSKDVTLYIEFMDEDDYRLTRLPFRDVSERDWYYDDVAYVYRNGYMDGISSTKFGGSMNTTRGQIVTILWRLTGEPRAAKKNQFNDVSSRQYYYDAISWAAEAGIVDGFDAKTFKPDANVTREQLAAILYRYAEYMNLSTRGAANLTKFSDYYEIGTWARDAMAWANYHGLINGTDYYHISPKGYATRAQIAAILHRFAVEFGA